MPRFIEPVIDRQQYCFLRETLDDSIPADHPVRVFDFILEQHDWSEWRARYSDEGRPAFPPDMMCKLLVYGYNMGIRSSRSLEHACRNSLDFMWLMSGRTPDHDTIAEFRRQHAKQFKKIFRTTVAACVQAGMVSAVCLVVDGTRVNANNSSAQTKTADDIEKMLGKLDERIAQIVTKAEQEDAEEDTLFGKGCSPNNLPRQLQDLRQQQARLKAALDKVRQKKEKAKAAGASEADAARKRVPITDPDSDVMKNKQGGFGPNYTPHVGVDSDSGVVLSEGVSASHQDADHLLPAIEEAQHNTQMPAQQVLADSNYATVENVEHCEQHHIDPCMPPINTNLQSNGRGRENPPWPQEVPTHAPRADGSMVDGTALPRSSNGKFDKTAFKYDAERDCFVCPTGNLMPPFGRGKTRRQSPQTKYRCPACESCPFAKVCTTDPKGRSVKRSQDDEVHDRQRERMKDPQRRQRYTLRRQTVEPTIGIFKEVFRLRRFLLRGLVYVQAEWTLASAAFNIKKLATAIGLVGLHTAFTA